MADIIYGVQEIECTIPAGDIGNISSFRLGIEVGTNLYARGMGRSGFNVHRS